MPINPSTPTFGGTPQYRPTTPFRRGIVEEVVGNEVMVRDLGTAR